LLNGDFPPKRSSLTLRAIDFAYCKEPARIDFKQKLYAQLDELLPPDVIIASSSSGLTVSEIQKGPASHPERCVIAHPFNPPRLIPLVELLDMVAHESSAQTDVDVLKFKVAPVRAQASRLAKPRPKAKRSSVV
jgi:3-hydroxyacyl-CoA dehydrogenase